MTILTTEYKYLVLLRLLKANESFENACSKSGLSLVQATKLLDKIKYSIKITTK